MDQFDRVVRASLDKRLSHGEFRLYTILVGASAQSGSKGAHFQVTLKGLMQLHPGIASRPVGVTTIIQQMSSLRAAGLLDIVGAIPRDHPTRLFLVKVQDPAVRKRNLASLVNAQ